MFLLPKLETPFPIVALGPSFSAISSAVILELSSLIQTLGGVLAIPEYKKPVMRYSLRLLQDS